jgi:hypothetical protein
MLPDSYTMKPGGIPAYFDAILAAQPPERFSIKFLENLGFTSTNDRLFIGILKELGFLSADGVPQKSYFEFLNRSRSKKVLAAAIQEMFGELFAVNTKADELNADDVKNKLRTLYAGKKSDLVIGHIAKTFRSLCEYADFSDPKGTVKVESQNPTPKDDVPSDKKVPEEQQASRDHLPKVKLSALQYHINVVLPDTRDQAVYDAIFRSLREHLG